MGTRAYGMFVLQRVRQEGDWGQGGSGNWTRRPFYSSALGMQQGLVTEPRLLGLGREPPKPTLDVIDVDGDVVVPVDVRHIGFWLKMLMGPPATTGAGPYVHAYTSGVSTLPSCEREHQHTKTGVHSLVKGIKVDTMRLEWARRGKAQATLGCHGRTEDLSDTPAAGTDDPVAYDDFQPRMASLTLGGTLLANVVGAQLTYSNGIYRVENIRPDGLIDGLDEGPVSINGELNIRFHERALLDQAVAGTPVELELGYVHPTAGHSLLLTVHEVYLSRPKTETQGPDGVQARHAFEAAANTAAGASMTATLTNDLPGYA